MEIRVLPVLALLLSVAPGCTREQVSRAGYETLQNVGKQQCEKDPSADCTKHKSYEEYRRERAAELRQHPE